MDIDYLIAHIREFFFGHSVIAIVIAVVIALLVIFRPKAMLKTAGMIMTLAVAAYLLSNTIDMADSGRSLKEKAVQTVR